MRLIWLTLTIQSFNCFVEGSQNGLEKVLYIQYHMRHFVSLHQWDCYGAK